MQLERMFGEGAKSALTFSSHRWGEQPLTSGNGGGKGGGHDDMGSFELRVPFVSRVVSVHGESCVFFSFNLGLGFVSRFSIVRIVCLMRQKQLAWGK